ncbi:MAG: hypothetical protein Q8L59_11205 [Phenylobacterium sp.]|uniref:hypothetical protein n=1 Tax=Phenylobacterium sp. TaxID=1871053 RepID=UPI0027365309|nr:hypothetical protein [Phenylobacterium sp.]MDP1642742.1 hypothetical protein [Phenylobacterium sp.]MDP3117210.1 hypothetical protein [Phenylobacterium sp.]
MSAIDDHSLLAMHAARMSIASIAQTMGWGEARTRNRLDALTREPGAGLSPTTPAELRQDSDEEPKAEAPIGEGEGLVLRSFATFPAGHGASCRIADGRHVYALTGAERLEPGARIRIVQDGEVWRALGAGAGHA